MASRQGNASNRASLGSESLRRFFSGKIHLHPLYRLRANFFDDDADDHPFFLDHLFFINFPVFVLAAHLLVSINERVHGIGELDDFRPAMNLYKLRPAVLLTKHQH